MKNDDAVTSKLLSTCKHLLKIFKVHVDIHLLAIRRMARICPASEHRPPKRTTSTSGKCGVQAISTNFHAAYRVEVAVVADQRSIMAVALTHDGGGLKMRIILSGKTRKRHFKTGIPKHCATSYTG